MKTRIVVRVTAELLKAIKPAAGQLSMFGGADEHLRSLLAGPTQPVTVKPHTRTTPSGQAAQVSGYTEQRRAAAEKPAVGSMVRFQLPHPTEPSGKMHVAGTVKRHLDDGRIEVKTQMHGYHEIHPSEVLPQKPLELKPKKPHEMTRDEFVPLHIAQGKRGYAPTQEFDEQLMRRGSEEYHRDKIRDAIREGKHVPPHVLADYPELKPKEPEKPKEPHETTRAERDTPEFARQLAERGAKTAEHQRRVAESSAKDPSQPPHNMTQEDFWREGAGGKSNEGRGTANFNHKEHVKGALAAGKPVPPHVLADYPDLKPKEPELNPKEPHEMTRAEYHESQVGKKYKDFIGRDVSVGNTDREKYNSGNVHQQHVRLALAAGKHIPKVVLNDHPDLESRLEEHIAYAHKTLETKATPSGKPMKRAQLVNLRGSLEQHQAALANLRNHIAGNNEAKPSEGQHVPPHVLADYPELKPKEPEKPDLATTISQIKQRHKLPDAAYSYVKKIKNPSKRAYAWDYLQFLEHRAERPERPNDLGTMAHQGVRLTLEEHAQKAGIPHPDDEPAKPPEPKEPEKMRAATPTSDEAKYNRLQSLAEREGVFNKVDWVEITDKERDEWSRAGLNEGQILQRLLEDHPKASPDVPAKPKEPEKPKAPPARDPKKSGRAEYEPLTTKSGRQIQPPSHLPMNTDRRATKTLSEHDQWLITEAAAEAKHRGDDWNYDNFSRLVGQKIHEADRTGANLYLFDQEEVPLKPLRKSLRLVIRKSLVHAYQRRAPSGQSVQVGEYSNKVQKKPTMPSQGHPLWAGASLPPQKPRQPVAPTRAPTRAVVRTRPGTAPPLRPTQAHYKPGLQKPGPSIGETSSGAVIHADSHRVHAGWSKTDHFEAAQAHKDQVAKLERRHQQSDPFEGELGAPAHPDAESEQATAHRARAAYHGRMADGDAKGAAAIAKYDHRFGEHLEGHQAEQHGAATEPAAHDSEKFIADMVTDILAGAQPQGRGGELSVSTQSLHKLPDGTYKPERQAMHKRILEARLAKAVKQDHPEAVFMGGGSASGKGTIQKRGLISLPQGAVVADADMMKTGDPEGQETGTPFRGIPEFGQLSKGGKSDMAAAFVHEESSDLNADLTHACYENGYHVIVDGTGDGSVAKMGKKVAAAKAAGHKVRAIYCTVPTDMAVERSMERAKNTGREVPEKAVRELHAGVSRVFPEVTKLFDDLELWDNTADPKLIYSKKSDRGETVHDPKAYQAFLAKANESSDERYDRASGKVTAMQKAMGGDKRKRVLMVPHEWPDADKRGESLRRLKKMGLHEHSKRKKQPPRKHGRHR